MPLSNNTLRQVATCVQDVCLYRRSMGGDAFTYFPLGQMLIGYVRGVAEGAGVSCAVLVKRATPFIENPEVLEDWGEPN